MSIIYSPIQPTVLMVKKHNKTGLLYFCKTVKLELLEVYKGSGTKWISHMKKHGRDVSNLWVSDVFYDSSITEFALKFSEDHDIVNNPAWANLMPEDGIGGRVKVENKPNCTCDECGLAIFKYPSYIKKSKHNFCSKSCTASYHNKLYNKRPKNKYEK